MKCDHIFRSGPLFEGHRFGGVSMGQCPKEALEGFVVCSDHVNKEALWMMVQHERAEAKKKLGPRSPYLNHPRGT